MVSSRNSNSLDWSRIGDAVKRATVRYGLYGALGIWALYCLFPFFYMLLMSTKSPAQMFDYPPQLFVDADFYFNIAGHYKWLTDTIPFWRNVWNSFYIASMSTVLSLVFCSLSGFAFAFYHFKGKNVLFTLLVATLMVPPILFIIPYFSMMSSWHWIDAPRALYLPSIANAFGVLLMRKHIESGIPRDLYDAAKIDGCSDWNIYLKVVIPMVKPGLGILAIISFFTSWNSYFYPLVIMMSNESFTVPIALNRVSGSMLAASLSVLPLLIVFLLASKWIIAGFTEGALKDF